MNVTPMMQQYFDAKAACGDALLFFRMGDFYELFHDDAKTAAQILGLTLTSRDKGENATPMAGFPHHQLESYLRKIIDAGHRAAVCEQVEDPKLAKGLVKRELTRVVTPGTLTDDALLDPRESNFLAAVATAKSGASKDEVGVAWVELSTGRFFAARFPKGQLADQLARIGPTECLFSEEDIAAVPPISERMTMTKRPAWAFSLESAQRALTEQFQTLHLEGFGFGDDDGIALRAAGAALDYLKETQRTSLEHLRNLIPYRPGQTLEIDEATRRSLELTRTMRDGKRERSLLGTIDRTQTSMGSRRLAEWLAAPLANAQAIEIRLDAVDELTKDAALRRDLREALKGVFDLQRLLARISTGRTNPRDLKAISLTLMQLPRMKARLSARKSDLLNALEATIHPCEPLTRELETALGDNCPLVAKDGGFVRAGYRASLDELRELAAGGKEWIVNYQAAESERSGIANLKVGFNKVFGYYIELTNTHREKAPAHYIRKQTVKNAERYITPELKEYEEKVLTAEERGKLLELEIFGELRNAVHAHSRQLFETADALADLDVLIGLAELAAERRYCRPKIVDAPVLEIEEGRHPVLEMMLRSGEFVPNDILASEEQGRLLILTGPNMAGKSTYIRQAALLVILAQLGSFVPAKRATIGVADRVFARVGASDELSRGQSTFMVEMTETARILNLATRQSLVILDEIGRGTSTYDGISLAWAIAEHLHDVVGARTLFATHYHELTQLAATASSARNLNVAVKEWNDSVVFLHRIVPGAADKSYGIHVARLAGVPQEVNERAKEILAGLEAKQAGRDGKPHVVDPPPRARNGKVQLTLFGFAEHPVLDEIRGVDADRLTPMEAFQKVVGWREKLEKQRPVGK
jgi:DNA mismatch repair protein MutS